MTVAHLHRLVFAMAMLVHIEGLMLSNPSNGRWSFSRKSTNTAIGQVKGERLATSLQLGLVHDQYEEGPVACLEGYIPDNQREELEEILLSAGYTSVLVGGAEPERGEKQSNSLPSIFRYKYIKASGMLKLIEDPNNDSREAPKYIPIQNGKEQILVANGWSFLDPDESEPLSPFDLDAANKEGQYKPRWGLNKVDSSSIKLSSLGYNIQRESYEDVIEASSSAGVTSQSKKVLLEGGTDPPHIKMTNNGYDFSSAKLQSTSLLPEGIFVCAIGSLPLFSTADMVHSIVLDSGGWLSFTQPIAEDHVELIHPDKVDLDQRIEVVDAKTGCHLGHYFGKSNGCCINASALNFVPLEKACEDNEHVNAINPFSWRLFLDDAIQKNGDSKPQIRPSYDEVLRKVILANVQKEEILFGAGCFWHIEFALRRLPGVIDTETGYAGGALTNPTYKDICSGTTDHAEVVKVSFDPTVCDARKLIDCWLAMHDPTIVRAHGKRARRTGQYRSCAFVFSEQMQSIAMDTVAACGKELGKELSSEVNLLTARKFWAAEERHQRHDERKRGVDLNTLTFDEWLLKYGRRSASVLGSSESIQVEPSDEYLDDGMARMMI
ncbi:hypothetical protein ACHAXR_010738 [Thalassiosira sp. AJA248-18]